MELNSEDLEINLEISSGGALDVNKELLSETKFVYVS